MPKILVTGATGFIGKRLVPTLISLGFDVVCVVSKNVSWLPTKQVIARLESETDWSQALSGIDIVIHLAARVHVMNEVSDSALPEYLTANSIGTKNLAEQAAKHQVKRFIFLSSIKVNGELTTKGLPFSEESATQPVDPYGQSKLYAEHYLQNISQNSTMEVVILRPPLVYGPGVKANFLKMMQLVSKRMPLPFAKVHNQRHFIYVDNLVSALCLVVTHPVAANQTYLVADENSFSLAQLLHLIAQLMNIKIKLMPIPVGVMEFIFRILGKKNLNQRLFSSLEIDHNKIKSQLGWNPPVSSEEGLKETVKWYQSEFNS